MGALWLIETKYGLPPPPPPPYPYTSCWAFLRNCGRAPEPRFVDLEQGMVYGHRLLKAYGNSIKDLRSHFSSRWGGLEKYGYKPLAIKGERQLGSLGGGGTSRGGTAGGGGAAPEVTKSVGGAAVGSS